MIKLDDNESFDDYMENKNQKVTPDLSPTLIMQKTELQRLQYEILELVAEKSEQRTLSRQNSANTTPMLSERDQINPNTSRIISQ